MLSVAATPLLGWLDEGIQAILPHRYYLRDVGFNALAGLMAVVACVVLGWARGAAGQGQERLSAVKSTGPRLSRNDRCQETLL